MTRFRCAEIINQSWGTLRPRHYKCHTLGILQWVTANLGTIRSPKWPRVRKRGTISHTRSVKSSGFYTCILDRCTHFCIKCTCKRVPTTRPYSNYWNRTVEKVSIKTFVGKILTSVCWAVAGNFIPKTCRHFLLELSEEYFFPFYFFFLFFIFMDDVLIHAEIFVPRILLEFSTFVIFIWVL